MNASQKREVVACLIKAGRKDLAQVVAAPTSMLQVVKRAAQNEGRNLDRKGASAVQQFAKDAQWELMSFYKKHKDLFKGTDARFLWQQDGPLVVFQTMRDFQLGTIHDEWGSYFKDPSATKKLESYLMTKLEDSFNNMMLEAGLE